MSREMPKGPLLFCPILEKSLADIWLEVEDSKGQNRSLTAGASRSS